MKEFLRLDIQALKKTPMLSLALGAWLLAALALALRIPFGAGTTDEAFYSAMPYSFLLGNKPYQAELALHQNAAILMMPLFRAYMWLFDSDGILVFNRWLYFAYICFCSFCTFRLVRLLANAAAGAWAGALVLTFSYYNLFALSYNTLGALGVLAGVLLSTQALLEKPVPNLLAATVFFATAAFSYPTFTCVAALQLPLVLLRLHQRADLAEFRRTIVAVSVATVFVSALAIGFLTWVTPQGIRRALEFHRAEGYMAAPVPAKAYLYRSPLLGQRVYLAIYAVVLAGLPFAVKLWKRGVALIAVVGPVAWLSAYYLHAEFLSSLNLPRGTIWLSAVPVLAPVCLLLARRYKHRWLVLEQLWAPGVLSAAIVVKTSANGSHSAHLGMLPCLIAGVVAFAALTAEIGEGEMIKARAAPWCFAGFNAAVLVTQIHTIFERVYDTDGRRMSEHNTWVHRGPYRGAIATPAKAKLLEGIDSDLKKLEAPGKTLAVFDDFSVAYLSTHMRPRTFTHWNIWVYQPAYGERIMKETYGEPASQPDFVVLVPAYLKKENLFLPYRTNYRPVIERPDLGYVIEQRVTSAPVAGAPATSPRSL